MKRRPLLINQITRIRVMAVSRVYSLSLYIINHSTTPCPHGTWWWRVIQLDESVSLPVSTMDSVVVVSLVGRSDAPVAVASCYYSTEIRRALS